MLDPQTRYELWKKYRNEIDKNVSLKKSVMASNKTLNVLTKRLLKVLPNFKIPDSKHSSILKIETENLYSPKVFSTKQLDTISKKIAEFEEFDSSSLSFINDLNFSTKQLDTIIKKLKEGKASKIKYINTIPGDLQLRKVKKVNL